MAMKDGCDPITSAKLALQLGATQLGHAQLPLNSKSQLRNLLGIPRFLIGITIHVETPVEFLFRFFIIPFFSLFK